jgi:hypothetical protein
MAMTQSSSILFENTARELHHNPDHLLRQRRREVFWRGDVNAT